MINNIKHPPIKRAWYSLIFFLFKYPTPSNLNYLWNFGVLALIFFFLQILTGLLLSIFYIPNIDYAFLSVENIMRNINYGWLIRYMHANGASFFFIVVYLHIFRNLYYSVYLYPKIYVWITGIVIFILMIIIAFTGYVLPWGQMSFWAATVITNLFSSIPIFGKDIVILLWGDYNVSNATLNRFFSLHFLLPFILFIFIIFHILFLHEKGSSNSLVKYSLTEKSLFHPFFTYKDLYIINLWFVVFFFIVGFYPDLLGHPDNYVPANPLVTPSHIVPEWYFLFFYAILRAIPSKLGGVLALLFSILILLVFPIFLKNKVDNDVLWFFYKTDAYDFDEDFDANNDVLNIFWQFIFFYFMGICILLSILGSYPAEGVYLILSKVYMFQYFGFFIIGVLFIKRDYLIWFFSRVYYIYYLRTMKIFLKRSTYFYKKYVIYYCPWAR